MDYQYYFMEFNVYSVTIRLLAAAVLGGIIGMDRERSTRSAGFRTHSLVCLGAALVMVMSHHINEFYGVEADVSRMGAQVISGIGFLGAGAIISSGNSKIRGLTTAAALWTCACVGLAIGIGFYFGAIITCAITLLFLRTLRFVDRIYRKNNHFVDLYFEGTSSELILQVTEKMRENNIEIIRLESTQAKVTTNVLGGIMTVKLNKIQDSDTLVKELMSVKHMDFVHKVYV